MISAREAAFRSLMRYETQGRYSNIETDSAIKKYGLLGSERALYTILVYGVIERKITLKYYLSHFCNKSYDKIDRDVRIIIEIAAYQILYLSRIPDHACVNEAVECAKRHCSKGCDAFVNAVLRRFISGYKKIMLPSEKFAYLSVKYSVPEWIISLWYEFYGENGCEEILDGIDEPPAMTLRTNTLVISRDQLVSKLIDSDFKAEITELSPYGIRLVSGASFSEVENFVQNDCYVQDECSQLAVIALDVKPGDFVIDTCACPGGKSFGIAMIMENKGRVLSLDLHKNKLSLVEKGANRLGIKIIETLEHNSRCTLTDYIGKADRVLCDVPCSGLGVIAKKPETRYKSHDDILRLPDIQYDILCASSKYLKSNGKVVYSTCTINKAENDDVVNRFISEHPDFELLSMTTYFPQRKKSDGFFVAVISKK